MENKLPTAEEKLKANFYNGYFVEIHSGDFVDEDSILNAYNLDNIK